MDTPKVGDKIYVDSHGFIGHGEDDVQGGLATVVTSELGMSGGKMVPFVTVAEYPGVSYNWEFLAELQAELKEEFGDEVAHPDPDYNDYGERW